jgi:tRNA(Arg) A34 adenosine deaminase TadA
MSFDYYDHATVMRQAIDLARTNPAAPFAALLFDRRNETLVASGINRANKNPVFHGEVDAINDYALRNGSDWRSLTLYSTAEPCCMCLGAILWAGISEVVFGASIDDLRSLGWNQIDISAVEVVARSWRPEVRVRGGVLGKQCRELFRTSLDLKAKLVGRQG